jgi:hypothetical protein
MRSLDVIMRLNIERAAVPVLKIADWRGVTAQNTKSITAPEKKTPQCLVY